jgi:hypothetical protein
MAAEDWADGATLMMVSTSFDTSTGGPTSASHSPVQTGAPEHPFSPVEFALPHRWWVSPPETNGGSGDFYAIATESLAAR